MQKECNVRLQMEKKKFSEKLSLQIGKREKQKQREFQLYKEELEKEFGE